MALTCKAQLGCHVAWLWLWLLPTNSRSRQHTKLMAVQTLVFNVFVFAQIWNSFNSWRLDTKLNVFEGVMKNWYFIAITAIGSSLLPEAALFLISSYRVVAQVLICLIALPHMSPLFMHHIAIFTSYLCHMLSSTCRPVSSPSACCVGLSLGLLHRPCRIIVSPSLHRHVTFAMSSHHLRLVVASP